MSTRVAGFAVSALGVLVVLASVLADLLRLGSDIGGDFGPAQVAGVATGAVGVVLGLVIAAQPHKSAAYVRLKERLSRSEKWQLVTERLHGVLLSLNLLYALILVYLFVLTAIYLKVTPLVSFTATKMVLVGVVAGIFVWVALLGGRRANRVLFIATTLALIAGQVALNPDRRAQFPAEQTRYPMPYIMFAGKPGALDHNALGYRGRMPPDEKDGEYRIFILGGSAVYVANFAPELDRLAHQDGLSDVAAYNWGVVSQVSGMEIATILHRVVGYDPDLVILYDGGNDITVPYIWDPRPDYPFNFVVTEQVIGVLQYGDLPTLGTMALAQSDLIRVLFRLELEQRLGSLARVRAEAGYNTPAWEEEVVDAYLTNVDRACRLAQAFDFKLVVFLQPLAEGQFTPEYQSYIHRQYDRVRQGFDDLTEEYSDAGRCYFIDASDVCEKVGCEFEDYIHVFSWYNDDIARYMYGYLTDLDLVR